MIRIRAGNRVPSLRMKTVSVSNAPSSAARESQPPTWPSTTSPGENAETRRRPTASRDVYPNSRSAPSLYVSILPSRSQVMTLLIAMVSSPSGAVRSFRPSALPG